VSFFPVLVRLCLLFHLSMTNRLNSRTAMRRECVEISRDTGIEHGNIMFTSIGFDRSIYVATSNSSDQTCVDSIPHCPANLSDIHVRPYY
jgi:hypothetical protein